MSPGDYQQSAFTWITRLSRGVAAAVLGSLFISQTAVADDVDFNRDIRPILSDHCFECHGPDQKEREAELRLDTRDGLLSTVDKNLTTDAAQPDHSELFRRLVSDDPDTVMPPRETGRSLTKTQIKLIRQWIQSGANWQQHWSFVTPTRPMLPPFSDLRWIRNPIDRFVLARLHQEGLEPSEAADRRTLLRRVSFDLTGLPPTPDEVQAFVSDDSPEAFEKVVDRLLASPRYAERMAIRWLDAARYADTSGYQSDGPRDMWRWRDWVIEAFDKNMPFDQFTIEQLAGDLLPDATLSQKIATGFNRNHRGNAEGGIVPEEFQVEYVVDRVDTTFTVWQGLTMGCGRCHSHKYDPISQQEYYQVFACFNNIPENGRALKEGNSPPYIQAPTSDQQRKIAWLKRALKQAEDDFAALTDTINSEVAALDVAKISKSDTHWTITESELLHAPLPEWFCVVRDAKSDADVAKQKTVKASPRKGFHDVELKLGGQKVNGRPGQLGACLELFGDGWLEGPGSLAKFGYFDRFSLGAFIRQEKHQSGTIISKMTLVEQGGGYHLQVTDDGRLQLNMGKRWLDDSLRVETIKKIDTGRWVHVFVTYDGTRRSDAVTFYIDGQPVEHVANLDAINQSFENDEPFRIGAGHSNFVGMIDEARVFDRELTPDEVAVVADHRSIPDLIRSSTSERGETGQVKIREFVIQQAGSKAVRQAASRLIRSQRAVEEFDRAIPTVMVMREMETPRATHVLQRGQYDRPGEQVEFGTPAALSSLPDDVPRNRLGLAKWLVDRNNPLTARVTVNRFWRNLFGTGLVATTEDFGVQGERPSHPQLLDWLAVEFMDSGWDVKRLLKTIVMSNTYRQSSKRQKDEGGRWKDSDPDNRLLSRGPRVRLSAEMIRDQALFVTGMLTEKLGGPSVRPYQPEGLLKEIASDTQYAQDHGANLYRRSLYTHWKRTVAPPMMTNFDAAGREACEVRQTRTNTPLQALNLLNEVTFVEAARVLAQNIQADADNDSERIRKLYQRVLSRMPTEREAEVLLNGLSFHRQRFGNDLDAARRLINTGEWPVSGDVEPMDLAAWTVICSTVLNLDETVTKE